MNNQHDSSFGKNSRPTDWISTYTPAPRSKLTHAEILATASQEFQLRPLISDCDQEVDLRSFYSAFGQSEPFRVLSIAANLAEAALSLRRPHLAHSLLLSVAHLNPAVGHRPSEIGRALVRCAESLGRTETSIRDVARLLVVYSQVCSPRDITNALISLVESDYLQSLDRLSLGIDTALLFKLTSCWWCGQDVIGNGPRITEELWQSFRVSRRQGIEWWDQEHVIARTAILQRITQPPTPTSTFLDQAQLVAIAPAAAPPGHCRFFAAAYLWQLLIRQTESDRHHQLKLASICPPRCFERILSRIGNLQCFDVDMYSPIALVTSVWLIAELWREDFKGTLLDIQDGLFEGIPESCHSKDLPVMFGLIPVFRGLWCTQKTSWAHNYDLRNSDPQPFEEDLQELFELPSSGVSYAPETFDAIQQMLGSTDDQFMLPAYHQSAHLFVDRFLEQMQGEPPLSTECVRKPAVVNFAEETRGLSSVPDAELRSFCNTLPQEAFLDLVLPARANLACGKTQRGVTLAKILLRKCKNHAHWIETYRVILQALRNAGCLSDVLEEVRHLTDSVNWIHEHSLSSLDIRCQVVGDVMRVFLDDDPNWVERASDAVGIELRKNLQQGDWSSDRVHNLVRTTEQRHLIPRALRSIIPSLPGERVNQILFLSITWDVTLAQRALIEKRRLWQPASVPMGTSTPTDDLQVALGPAQWANEYSSATTFALGTVLCANESKIVRGKNNPRNPSRRGEASQSKQKAGSRHQGVTDENDANSSLGDRSAVTSAVSRGDVLVKLGFTLDGRFAWSAFRSDGAMLELVGSDRGYGSENASESLRSIIHDFDGACNSILTRSATLGTIERMRTSDGWSPYEELLDAIRDCEVEYFAEQFEMLTKLELSVESENCKEHRTATALDTSTLAALADWFGTYEELAGRRRAIPTLEEWHKFWGAEGCRRDLNRATESFLTKAASVIPVDDISKVIADQDVLVMLEDALFAIPFSFLRNSDGRRMFEIVRSTRTVLSPAVHESFVRDESKPYISTPNDHVLCISGVPGKLPDEMVATKRLFERHQSQAEKWGLQWRGAWDRPRGSHNVMARGIHDAEQAGLRIALLTVLGHGHKDGGVEMRTMCADDDAEYWQAHSVGRAQQDQGKNDLDSIRPACDLSSVDFLIQVSCSVGRAKQDGLYDVQGFPANLVVAGARSTAAARWPILADEAERFANYLAARYLLRRDEAIRDSVPFQNACIRGLAMADTRKWWLEEFAGSEVPNGNEFVGLHTAAAFELYGFG